jgi:acetyltransferase-like isoleucine patch superfamily enzyme
VDVSDEPTPGRLAILRRKVRTARALAREARVERATRLHTYRTHEEAYDDSRLTRGRHTYGNPQVVTYPGDTARVRIGAFTSIALDVVLMDGGNHHMDWVTTFPLRAHYDLPGAYEDGHPFTRGDITIGNDVWLGRGSKILSGVTIGDGAIVGAYAVVAKDVRPYAIVVGCPQREVRRRFTDEQIDALQRIAWWDWTDQQIKERVEDLSSANLDAFIARYDVRSAA